MKKSISARFLARTAIFVALSIVLGKFLAFNIGQSIRISFENLPILLSGLLFGPAVGAAVALCADVLGCFLAGYAINPLVTLGAVSIGFISGTLYKYLPLGLNAKIALSVFCAHTVGSMIIKSIGLYSYYQNIADIMLRIPTYICIAVLEIFIIRMLINNRTFLLAAGKGER